MKIDSYKERLARIKTIPDLHKELSDAKRMSMTVKLHVKNKMPLEHRYNPACLKMYPHLHRLYMSAKQVEQQLERNFTRIQANMRELPTVDSIPKSAVSFIRSKSKAYYKIMGRLPAQIEYKGVNYQSSAFMAVIGDIANQVY